MDYTKNYHLPQWVATDRIMRKDFNEMCQNMEAGLNSNAQTAEAAHREAVTPHYAVGSYVGTGEKNRHITVGFRPSFIIVSGLMESTTGMCGLESLSAFSCGGNLPNHLQFTADGFTVNCNSPATVSPNLNLKDRPYDYIAFR